LQQKHRVSRLFTGLTREPYWAMVTVAQRLMGFRRNKPWRSGFFE
jgi:hypothetical protein